MPENWVSYYWALAKEFGIECLHITRSDMLATVLAIILTFIKTGNALDFRTGLLICFEVLLILGVLHSLRLPWQLFERMRDNKPQLSNWWGAVGAVFFSAFIVALVYAVAYVSTMQPAVIIEARLPDGRNVRIAQLERELTALVPAPELDDSLRRRTTRLADEILAWEQERYEHHPSYAYPDKQRDPNLTPERQNLIDACLKYDRETFDQFNRRFKEQWIEIVRKYELENIKVGTLVNDAEQNHPGQDASMGAQFVPIQMDNGTYFSALSRFRELAYHVDANGHRIDLH